MTSVEETASWKALIHRLDEFVEAWEAEESPPELERFLPHPEATHYLGWLIELIKVDLEFRWERNLPERFLEDYAARFSVLNPGGLFPHDLIYEEFHIRRQFGEEIDACEYRERFAPQADELESLFRFESPDSSTSLRKQGGLERFEVGQTLDDFDLMMPLGEGAFAQVFLARQVSMQRLVAVKISIAKGEEHKTLAQLDHPHIVRVYSQTVLADRGIRLLYMQYHAGGTLKDVIDGVHAFTPTQRDGARYLRVLDEFLEQRGAMIPLDSLTRSRLSGYDWPRVVAWIGARIAEALHYAHGKGVLHRDLKPANVLVGADGAPLLADFNISFCKRIAGSSPVTYFGGSLAYMSPEQLEACDPTHEREPDELDPRSDVYSLGVMLWELLTGHRPFPDLAWALKGSQLLREMGSDRVRGLAGEVFPHELSPLMRRAFERTMAFDREERFPDAATMARHLDLCLDPELPQILHPQQGLIDRGFARWPRLGMIVLTGIPNGIMSLLNIAYNYREIVALNNLEAAFGVQVGLLNALAYGLGFTCVALIGSPLARVLSQTTTRPTSALRSRAIHLGYWFAGISLSLWLLCGILFPLGLHLQAGHAVLNDYVHFFASHIVNGSLAALGAFYLGSLFSLSKIMPLLVNLDRPDPACTWQLQRFDHGVQTALGIAVTMPMVSILFAVSLSENRYAFAGLALTGLIGAGLAHRWTKSLRRLVETFLKITR